MHEIPTVGLAAWGLGFWSPKVLIVDLMGTCDKSSPALQKRLLARLPSWAKSMTNWSPEDFAMRSRLRWQCIDCAGHCNLDESLAEHVEKLVKAKVEQDRKDDELHQVVGCHLADPAENSLLTEVSLLEHLRKRGPCRRLEDLGGTRVACKEAGRTCQTLEGGTCQEREAAQRGCKWSNSSARTPIPERSEPANRQHSPLVRCSCRTPRADALAGCRRDREVPRKRASRR